MVGKFIFLAFFSSQRIYVNRHHETFYLFLLGKTPRSLVQIIFSLFVYCQIESRGVPNDIRRLSRITFVGVPDCYSVPKNNTFLFST